MFQMQKYLQTAQRWQGNQPQEETRKAVDNICTVH